MILHFCCSQPKLQKPIRREKVNETIAPLWLQRFPVTEFGDSAGFNTTSETLSVASEDLACTPDDIAHKLNDIESLFAKNTHFTDIRIIYDQLHELKGDLLTLNSDASMISILGMINLLLMGNKQSPEVILQKWHSLRDRVNSVINLTQRKSNGGEGNSATLSIFRRASIVKGPLLKSADASNAAANSHRTSPSKIVN